MLLIDTWMIKLACDDAAKEEVYNKTELMATQESKFTSLRMELTDTSQKLAALENECSSLHKELANEKDAVSLLNEKLQIATNNQVSSHLLTLCLILSCREV